MSIDVATLQILVREEASDKDLIIESGAGLALLNMVYLRVANIGFPEFHYEDTSLTTTSGTASYTWPTTKKYVDVRAIEIQDGDNSDAYVSIPAMQVYQTFSSRESEADGFPELYLRSGESGSHVVKFAPAPGTTGKTIRISGIIEPDYLTSGTSETKFLTRTVDNALAQLVAAAYHAKRGRLDRAAELTQRAAEKLSLVAGREVLPSEIATGAIAPTPQGQ